MTDLTDSDCKLCVSQAEKIKVLFDLLRENIYDFPHICKRSTNIDHCFILNQDSNYSQVRRHLEEIALENTLCSRKYFLTNVWLLQNQQVQLTRNCYRDLGLRKLRSR